MSDRHTVAMTRPRAEVIRAITADMAFTDGLDRTLAIFRARICDRVRHVLGDDCTDLEIWTACCDEPEAERAGRTKR